MATYEIEQFTEGGNTYKYVDATAQAALANKVDKVTGKGLSANDFTNELKTKLDGIESGAEVNPTIDSSLSSSSTNPVQNAVITTALADKVDAVNGKGLSTNDFTDTLKTKLEGIEAGAQVNPTIDSALSSSSENAVQNKVVTAALDGKVDEVTGKGLSTNDYTDAEKALVATIPDKADADDVTEVDTSNSTPFLYRETPYEADGVFLDELVGGSVAWNQLAHNGNFESTSGWYTTSGIDSFSVSNNEATVVVKSGYTDNTFLDHYNFNFINGHKYIVSFEYNNTSSIDGAYSYFGTYPYTTISGQGVNSKNAWSKFQRVLTTSNTTEARIRVGMRITSAPSSTWTYKIRNVICIDLTQMFGTTIADYIYTLEQATAGSGIAWLKSHGFFTKDYYPYNTGELISVKTSGKKYVGFNQWDEEWELGAISVSDGSKASSNTNIRSKNYIPVIGGETYYFNSYQLRMPACYDGNKTFISAAGATAVGSSGWLLTMPENAKYMLFDMSNNYGITYNHDICINISKPTGTPKNGDYVPYEEHTYDISNIDLRGITKLVNNELVYDGDIYESDGDVTRKFAEYTFTGDENFTSASVGRCYFYATSLGIKYPPSRSDTANIIANGFATIDDNHVESGSKQISAYDNQIGFCLTKTDSAGSVSDLQTYLRNNPTKLVFEKATPTTETTDSYTNPQICDKDGTEEFIDNRTVPIPVGHNSRYADLPVIMDGDYLGYMTRNFASKEYVKAIIDDLPRVTYDFRPISPTQVDVSAGMGTTVSITTRYSYVLTLIRMRLSSNGEVVASAMCYGTFEERLTYKSLDGTTAVSAKVEKVDDGYEVSNELESTAKVYIDIIPLFAHAIG